MQRAILGKSGSEAAFGVTRSDSESIFQQQFGEYHGYDGCYSVYYGSQYILTPAQSLGSQLYYKKSQMTCWCIIQRKRAGIHKMDYHMLRRKYLLGCLGKLGEVLKQQ